MVIVYELKKYIKKTLAAAGVFAADFETNEIIREYTGLDPFTDGEKDISVFTLDMITNAVKRRAGGEPLQYIFGRWEFMGLEFFVGKGVLIPRPETELLAETALSYIKQSGGSDMKVLDLCSGTGCIAVSVSVLGGVKCFAAELYDEAFSYLEKNTAFHSADVEAVKGDALDPELFAGTDFDIILSNPPYLTREEMSALPPEVRREPETALFGGDDGLFFYRKMIPLWSRRLKKDGLFAVEHGEDQGEAIREIMRGCGLSPETVKDLSGFDRMTAALKI